MPEAVRLAELLLFQNIQCKNLKTSTAKGSKVFMQFKVKGAFRLRNFNIVGFYYLFNCFNCYMFRSYDHLQVHIFC
jgi:hypothetical protein